MNSDNSSFPHFSADPCSSFYQYLTSQRPELLPMARWGALLPQQGVADSPLTSKHLPWPHGTTVLAFIFENGVVIGPGDGSNRFESAAPIGFDLIKPGRL